MQRGAIGALQGRGSCILLTWRNGASNRRLASSPVGAPQAASESVAGVSARRLRSSSRFETMALLSGKDELKGSHWRRTQRS